MQWASSTAKHEAPSRWVSSMRWVDSPAGAPGDKAVDFILQRSHRLLTSSWIQTGMKQERQYPAAQLKTWSSISATSGEITTTRPPRMRAGS